MKILFLVIIFFESNFYSLIKENFTLTIVLPRVNGFSYVYYKDCVEDKVVSYF